VTGIKLRGSAQRWTGEALAAARGPGESSTGREPPGERRRVLSRDRGRPAVLPVPWPQDIARFRTQVSLAWAPDSTGEDRPTSCWLTRGRRPIPGSDPTPILAPSGLSTQLFRRQRCRAAYLLTRRRLAQGDRGGVMAGAGPAAGHRSTWTAMVGQGVGAGLAGATVRRTQRDEGRRMSALGRVLGRRSSSFGRLWGPGQTL